MKIIAILAMDESRGIGKNGTLPWNNPEDLKHFKECTLGSPIIMGYRTYESIGRPLPGRRNIVLSHTTKDIPGVEVFSNISDCLALLSYAKIEKAFVIGGGTIYQAFFDEKRIDEVYVSRMSGDYQADVFAPEFEKNFDCVAQEQKETFVFEIWRRK